MKINRKDKRKLLKQIRIMKNGRDSILKSEIESYILNNHNAYEKYFEKSFKVLKEESMLITKIIDFLQDDLKCVKNNCSGPDFQVVSTEQLSFLIEDTYSNFENMSSNFWLLLIFIMSLLGTLSSIVDCIKNF